MNENINIFLFFITRKQKSIILTTYKFKLIDLILVNSICFSFMTFYFFFKYFAAAIIKISLC